MTLCRPASCSIKFLKSPSVMRYSLHSNSQRQRQFSTTRPKRGHYETLGIPRNASKNQVKSSYFKLSKMYHPDTTKDPKAKDKFHEISEAYSVLGDDRQRRAYDRSLMGLADQTTHGRQPSAHPSSPYDGQWGYETRRRGASYAWEHPRRQRPPSGTSFRPGAQQHGAGRTYSNPHTDPFSSPNVRRATGTRRRPEHTTDEDRVAQASALWRAVQVTSIIVFIGMLGGWSANAT